MGAGEDETAAREHYAARYEIIAHSPFVAPRPVLLADHPREDKAARHCRFCRRSEPEATFKSDAHAAPEFLGNRSILSLNECDECNARFDPDIPWPHAEGQRALRHRFSLRAAGASGSCAP